MSSPLTNYSEVSIPTVDDDEDTWGGINNGTHQLWDRALGGRVAISTTGGTTVLTSEQAQNGHIQVSGTLASDAVIQFPTGKYRFYRVRNATTGTYVVTCTTGAVGGSTVSLPPSTGAAIIINGDNVQALGAPVSGNGGFPDTFRQSGKAYDGPGLVFQDGVAGLARRSSGVIGVNLLDSAAGDQIRFHGANTAAAPLIGLAPTGAGPWSTGLGSANDEGVRTLLFSTDGTQRGYFRRGFVVGSPTGFDKGVGTLNAASGVYVNNVLATVTQESTAQTISGTSISVAHGLGSKPRVFGYKLRNVTAEHGYVTDEDTNSTWQTTSDATEGATVWANATNVGISLISSSSSLRVVPKAGGASPQLITPASWRIVFLYSL